MFFSENVKQMETNLQPNRLVKFDNVFPISAKKRLSTEELKAYSREVLDFYADKELEADGKVEKAITEIQDRNTEKFYRHLV